MRSYLVARIWHSIVEFIGWVLLIVGLIYAVALSQTISLYPFESGLNQGLAQLVGLLPGLALAFSGLCTIAFMQTCRAAVDTAEYTQHMLKISRDQIEYSKAAVRHGKQLQLSLETLMKPQSGSEDETGSSLSQTHLTPNGNDPAVPQITSHDVESESVRVTANTAGSTDHKGHKIEHREDAYHVAGVAFSTLEKAKAWVNQLGINPAASSKEQSKS